MKKTQAGTRKSSEVDFDPNAYPMLVAEAVAVEPQQDFEKVDLERPTTKQPKKTQKKNKNTDEPVGSPTLLRPQLSGQSLKPWPPALRDAVVANLTKKLDDQSADNFLSKHNWPDGLRKVMLKNLKKLPIRFFIVDDSGSMSINDGRKIMEFSSTNSKVIQCTRWAELTQTLRFHCELAETAKAISEIRLLNGADPVMVGLGDDNGEGLKFANEILSDDPSGQTPLCAHINSVVSAIQSISTELRANGQKAAVIIATDGEATDGDVTDALRPLQNLPVWLVIRLCTNENRIVDYWNHIDKELELEMDVIDDVVCDAQQVADNNGWLVYAESIHKLREFGVSTKELDLIDESTLGSEHMRSMCSYLLTGGVVDALPHPEGDWLVFLKELKTLNDKQAKVFCPLTGQMRPWVDLKKLNAMYGGGSSANVRSGAGSRDSQACCMS